MPLDLNSNCDSSKPVVPCANSDTEATRSERIPDGKQLDITILLDPVKEIVKFVELNYPKLPIVSSHIDGFKPPYAIPPYLPPVEVGKMTLCLELDEVLIKCEDSIKDPSFAYVEKSKDGGQLFYIKIRNGLQWFLATSSKLYDIVVFTKRCKASADAILDYIDPHKYIIYRLYEEHCRNKNGKVVKNLTNVGRPMDTIVLVDLMEENDSFNLIPVLEIMTNMSDNVFQVVMDMLKVVSDKESVKEAIGEDRQDYVRSKLGQYAIPSKFTNPIADYHDDRHPLIIDTARIERNFGKL